MPPLYDDMGTALNLAGPPRRVVSLVPSLTEAIAASRPDVLVGATRWCTHPGDLDVARVRGTKNPDREAIMRLRPDLVIANKEENRELDVARLRAAGVQVWVTVIETVPQALDSLERMLTETLGAPPPRLARPGTSALVGAASGHHRHCRGSDLAGPLDGGGKVHLHR